MLVDTNFLVELLREQNSKRRGPATVKLQSLQYVKLQMSVFVLCEQRAGALRSRNPDKETARVAKLSEYVQPVYPGDGFATTYAEIETSLRRQGTPIPIMDLLTASLAVSLGTPILTRDTEHFGRVPGIVVESF